MVGELPSEPKDILASFCAPTDCPEIAQAAVQAFIRLLYVDCHSLDDIATHLHQAGFFSTKPAVNVIRSALVSPICNYCRWSRLRFDGWWDIPGLFQQFHSFYTSRRLPVIGRRAMSEELKSYWMLRNPELIERLLDGVEETSSDGIWSVLAESASTSAGRALEGIRSDPDAQTLVDQYIQKLPNEIHRRDDLIGFCRFFRTLGVAKQLAGSMKHRIRGELQDLCDHLHDLAARRLSYLSEYETRLMVPEDPNRALLEACAAANADVIHIWQELPEVVNGKDSIPDWIYDYVFAKGGRLHHLASGPILHLLVVLDRTDGIPGQRIGFLPLTQEGDVLRLELVIPDSQGGTALPFSYDTGDTECIRELSLLCLCGEARLDFLRIQEPGGLEIIFTCRLRFPQEWLSGLQTIVLPLVQARFAGYEKQQYKDVYRMSGLPQHSDEAAFLMCEHGKSERLLEDLDDFGAGEDNVGLRDQYRRMRHCLLDRYSARARLLLLIFE
jgi:hypothetical protein